MKPKFKDKFRVESIRLPNRDYAANKWYFVTICTHDRQWFFGDAIAGEMQLSFIGKVAQRFSAKAQLQTFWVIYNCLHLLV